MGEGAAHKGKSIVSLSRMELGAPVRCVRNDRWPVDVVRITDGEASQLIPLQTSFGNKVDRILYGHAPHSDDFHSSTVFHTRHRIGANHPRLQTLH